jgi:PAS domain S-box-containing protein
MNTQKTSAQKTKEELLQEIRELHEKLNLFLNFFNTITDGIIIVQDGRVKNVNQSAAQMVNVPAEKLIGTTYDRFIHPEDVEKVRKAYEGRLKGEDVPTHYELKIQGADGKVTYIEVVNSSVIIYQGKPTIIVVIRDITQRKKAEETIREKALFFESLFENSPEAVALLDKSGHVIKVNKEFESMFGYKISEMEGKLLDYFVARGELLEEATQIRKRTDKGEKVELEATRFKKDGSSFDVHITESPIKSGDEVIGKYVIYRDISARKKAERELKESEKSYRELVEWAEAGILIDDKDGYIIYANDRVARIFGFKSVDELKKVKIYDLVHPEERQRVLNYHQRRILGKRAPRVYEFKGIRQDGEPVYIEVAACPLTTEEGIIGTRSCIWDISDRKRMEELLKKSLKEKDIMLHEIHHRVKNNMQIIISLMRIQARRIKNRQFIKYLQTLQDRVYSMSLIHDHFYKKTELDKINIASYIEDLVTHLYFIYNQKEEQIQINLDLEKIYLDLNKAIPFGMLINEIITNVLKHAFPGKKKGILSIRLFRDGNKKIRLLVNDTGIGLPDDIDVENPSTMGFQLMRDLTQQLGGEIQIKSNGGTQIKVIFPGKN